MTKEYWYALYRDVRTPVLGLNAFPKDQRADIALAMAKADRKERYLARRASNATQAQA